MTITATAKPVLDDIDRENLLDMASHVTTLADDEHLVVDNARVMEAWAVQGRTRKDVQRRMEALGQVYRNLKRLNKLPMDRPEQLTARAAIFHQYIDEAHHHEVVDDEPVELLPVSTADGVEFFIEID